jgi:nicotinamidase/pyrazinamidase
VSEALLIVDFQNDFTPGGALEVPNGDEIADRVNELATSGGYEIVIATRDWHPRDHGSFKNQGGTWPQHCVAGTGGAEIHAALDQCAVDAVIDKGQDPATEGYSAFEAPELQELLNEHEINAVTVVGLATDYCVKNTALDALKAGLEVRIDSAATRGVDVNPGDSKRALEELREAGAEIT